MHANLRYLLDPRSIAIVGANDRGNMGARTLANAIASGFAGPIYPVNPNYQRLQDRPCYPGLAALPERPDQVVISVPANAALEVLGEAAQAAIPSAVLFAEGFADAGTDEGRRRDDELLALAADGTIAVSGPNSMGLLSLERRFSSSFMNMPAGLTPGGISIVSQSGGLINALTELGRNRGLGFNYLISAGNEAVIGAPDYLDWLADDAGTRVVICIVEGVKDGPRFRAALTRATARKPVVVLKLGRSDLGGRATQAHTGSLAGNDGAFRALCTQCGAVLADSLDVALEMAALLPAAPLPRGDRVVMFSTSGGATVLTTDLGVEAGLNFPPLGSATDRAIRGILEVDRPFTNPFDVVGNPRIVRDDNMTRCLTTLVEDDAIDMVGFVLVLQRDTSAQRQKLLDQIRAVAARTDKPIIVLPEMTMHWREAPPDAGVPVTGTLGDGLTAMRALIEYAAWRRAAGEAPPAPLATPAIDRPDGHPVLTEYESKRILAAAGLPVTREALARNEKEAVAAARDIGYPVVLKACSPALVHKSEAGAIALGLAGDAAVGEAYGRLARLLAGGSEAAREGVLVQEMVAGGLELFLGMNRDPVLGPVVVFGPGGVFVELMGDAMALGVPPFRSRDIDAMMRRAPALDALLAGHRGAAPRDRAALTELIARFGALCAGLGPEIAAIDLNPVMALPAGQGLRIVDATIEFAPRAP